MSHKRVRLQSKIQVGAQHYRQSLEQAKTDKEVSNESESELIWGG